MNNDKFQRQMEFILSQQARFDANIGRQQEKHVQLQDIVGRLATVTLEGFKAHESKVASLIDAQIKTEGNISTLTERMTVLAEGQSQTDDRLNTLINVVERHA